jgi:hypothetical protein
MRRRFSSEDRRFFLKGSLAPQVTLNTFDTPAMRVFLGDNGLWVM